MVGMPLNVVTLLLTVHFLPPGNSHTDGPHFSLPDTIVGTLAFNLLVATLDNFTRKRSLALVTARLIMVIIINVFFVHHRLSLPMPLLPISLLHVPLFSLSVYASIYSFYTRVLTVISLPFCLRAILKHDRIRANLLLAP